MTCNTSATAVSSLQRLIELPPEFRVGALKIGQRVVNRGGHALILSGRGSGTTGL
jgi:hypothetical protein